MKERKKINVFCYTLLLVTSIRRANLLNLEAVQLPWLPRTISARSECLTIIYLLDIIYSEEDLQDLSVTFGSVRILNAPSNASADLFLSLCFSLVEHTTKGRETASHTSPREKGLCLWGPLKIDEPFYLRWSELVERDYKWWNPPFHQFHKLPLWVRRVSTCQSRKL